MSHRPVALLSLLLAQCSSSSGDAAGLGHSQDGALSWTQTHITPGQPITVGSTRDPVTLIVDGSDEMQTVSLQNPISVPVSKVTAPATIGIHPNKPYFYINDGEGSGQFSNLSVYRVSEKSLLHLDIAPRVKDRFRAATGCSIDLEFISIAGQAWTHDGADIVVAVESLDRSSSCDTSAAAAMRINVNQGSVQDVYSRREFRRRFCASDIVREQIGICSGSNM